VADPNLFQVGDHIAIRFAATQTAYRLEQVAVVLVGACAAVSPIITTYLAETDGVPERLANLAQPRKLELSLLGHRPRLPR